MTCIFCSNKTNLGEWFLRKIDSYIVASTFACSDCLSVNEKMRRFKKLQMDSGAISAQ